MPTAKTARRLRRSQTEAEALFWARVRARQLHGAKFKRQCAIGDFIVDFLCFDARLIVELDGGQHADQVASDAEHTQKLEALGYRVLRFWNNDVLTNIEGVSATVAGALVSPPSNNAPSPAAPQRPLPRER
ncbi:MAG: endonuclease domain-containing protein [Rhodospirillaceae bacterium]|nr:endonuclease domain-containing protein [Rhodospirillaceae bacterium]